MTSLSSQQKQLLFDYCVGLTSGKESAEAEVLISSNEEAAEVHSKLKAVLAALDTLEPEPCPDDLTEGTIWRLTNFSRSSQLRLHQLLATEQARSAATKSRFWWNLGQMVATAAVILFVAGISIPPLRQARQNYWQQCCKRQLSQIWRGINNYSSDYDGKLPAVATTAGAPWWKVGYKPKSNENHSNTRHIWLLAKGGYLQPTSFVCPGRRQGRAIRFDVSQVKNFNDFPARRYITYSLQIRCNKSKMQTPLGRKALMADLNPLFERLPRNDSNSLKLQLNKTLSILNSINHNRRGQNVLFSDGSSSFVKTRYIGIAEDDIFTLQDTDIYQGIEVPSSESDSFLAP